MHSGLISAFMSSCPDRRGRGQVVEPRFRVPRQTMFAIIFPFFMRGSGLRYGLRIICATRYDRLRLLFVILNLGFKKCRLAVYSTLSGD